MKLERYNSYKDSEINWLGEIPSEWKITTIKNIFRYFGSGSTPQSNNTKYYENGNINWLNTSDLKNFYIEDTKFNITDLALKETGLKIYPINSIAVAMYGQGETRGTPALLKIPTTTNQASCMMYKTFSGDERYILWWFVSKKESLRAINVGATQPNMNADFIKNLFVSLPQKQIQIKIADYLDIKTQKIDKEILILEQKIEKYKELKQTIIAETVLRGLNKNVKLKNSEIEWIGDIPKHWEVNRLKDIAILSAGNSMSNKEDYEINNDAYPYIATKDINIDTNHINYENGIYVPKIDLKYKIAQKHTTLLCIEGGSAGKKVAFLNKSVCYVNKLCNIKSKSSMFPKYTYYYVASHSFRQEFFSYINGLIGGVSIFTLKTFSISIPPYEEQVAIANYLDEKTSKIDSIVEAIGKKIEVLKEFRKTLINDVVTGKVKVA